MDVYFVVLLVLPTVCGHGMYVPGSACVDMIPSGHKDDSGNKAYSQTTESPYIIDVSSTTYMPNQEIQITVYADGKHGIDFFEGILLQVRRADCSEENRHIPVGVLSISNDEDFLTNYNCFNEMDTISHKAHAHIYNRTITWRAPPMDVGHVYVRATVARRQKTFWTNVNSEFIRSTLSSGKPETCAKPPTCKSASVLPTMFLLLVPVILSIFGLLNGQ